MVKLRHTLEILRNVDRERPFDVALADLVLDERRLAPSFHQLGKSLFVELSVRAQSARLLEGGDRLSRVLAGFSVDHARREIRAIKQNLCAQQDRARGLARPRQLWVANGAFDRFGTANGSNQYKRTRESVR